MTVVFGRTIPDVDPLGYQPENVIARLHPRRITFVAIHG
jgi:hypothetical protein